MHKFKKALILPLLSFFLFSLTGCFLLPEDEEVLASPVILKDSAIARVDTENVRRGQIVKKITFWGYFMSHDQVELSFAYTGRLETVNVAQGDTVKAGDVLAKLESDNMEDQLSQLEISLKKAQLNYDRLKTEYDINGGGDKFQLEDARLNVESIELSMAGLKEDLSKVSIVSPVSGAVSYVASTAVGEPVLSKVTFVTVCNKSDMVVVAKKSSMKEDIPIDSVVDIKYNGKTYTGKVLKTPIENINEKNTNFNNAYSVKVDGLDTNSVNLNDIASISYIVQEADNALIISKTNIKADGNKKFVYVYKDGAIEEREIVSGIESENGVDIEIKDGLTEEDLVVVQ